MKRFTALLLALVLLCGAALAENADAAQERTDFACRAGNVLSALANGSAFTANLDIGGQTQATLFQWEDDGSLSLISDGFLTYLAASVDSEKLLLWLDGQTYGITWADWLPLIEAVSQVISGGYQLNAQAISWLGQMTLSGVITSDGRTTIIRLNGSEIIDGLDKAINAMLMGDEPLLPQAITDATGLDNETLHLMWSIGSISVKDILPEELTDTYLFCTITSDRIFGGTRTLINASLTMDDSMTTLRLTHDTTRSVTGNGFDCAGEGTLRIGDTEYHLSYSYADSALEAVLTWEDGYDSYDVTLKGHLGEASYLELTSSGSVSISLTAIPYGDAPSFSLTWNAGSAASMIISGVFGENRQTLDYRYTEFMETRSLTAVLNEEDGTPTSFSLNASDTWSGDGFSLLWVDDKIIVMNNDELLEAQWLDDQAGHLTITVLATRPIESSDGAEATDVDEVNITISADESEETLGFWLDAQVNGEDLASASLTQIEKQSFSPIDPENAIIITPDNMLTALADTE